MNLDYSFGTVPSLWIDGPRPSNIEGAARIYVDLHGAADGSFPATFAVGDLLSYRRSIPKEQHALTLLLEYVVGHNPPLVTPPPMGKFYPVPGAPIMGQVRIALNKEATAAIQKSGESEVPFKISLSDVQLRFVAHMSTG